MRVHCLVSCWLQLPFNTRRMHNKRQNALEIEIEMLLTLKCKLLHYILPIFAIALLSELLLTTAYMQSVRVDEIPFGRGEVGRRLNGAAGIYAKTKLEQQRGFLHIFNVPYIVCFFAARGKWPFIPQFMQPRVDVTAKTLFSQNDSYIRQFCSKWMQIKECFRPIFAVTTVEPVRLEVESLAQRATPCTCAGGTESPVVFFDRDHIGNVSAETVRNTIEFLETFLPTPTRKSKRKNRVRGRLDEIDID